MASRAPTGNTFTTERQQVPNILVKVPKGAFPGGARTELLRHITEAAAMAERIPADPAKRFTSWVALDNVEEGMLTCGGVDHTEKTLPCIVVVYVPEGVLDAEARATYVRLMHQAFERAQPAGDKRRLFTSVILQEVAEGTWGGNGAIWTLPGLARVAGYAHLQHLVTP